VQGHGAVKVEMSFLPDVYVNCEVCHGERFNQETLDIRYRGKNMAQILDLTFEEAKDFFMAIPRIRHAATWCPGSDWAISESASQALPFPAERPSASSWLRSWPSPPGGEPCTFSMSRPRACISVT